MTSPNEIVIDPWAGLSHRPLLNPGDSAQGSLAPSWVGGPNSPDVRRLNAYLDLASRLRNTSRVFMRDSSRRSENREFNDAAAIRNAILASLLGESVTVQVEGAEGDEPKPPESDAEVTPPVEGEEPPEPAEPDAADESFAQELAEWKAATARQEWIDEWWTYERGPLKVFETERNAVGLGDGVYLLGWDNDLGRVVLTCYDPGFYFPVLPTGMRNEYPDRCHLAWQYDDAQGVKWVDRITFERVSIVDAVARGVQGLAGEEHRYPYQETDETPSKRATLMSYGRWRVDQLRAPAGVDSFEAKGVEWVTLDDGTVLKDHWVGHDFIPVVHIPNTVALSEHFGDSSITGIAQLLDDIQLTDSDYAAWSAINGTPPLGVDEGNVSTLQKVYGPGTIIAGKVSVIDTSKGGDGILKRIEHLLDRASTNARVPDAVMGRGDPSKFSSGFHMDLAMGPLRSLIGEMRLVRDDKYALLFKMVQRLAIVAGALGADGPGVLKEAKVLPIALSFGAFMPTDQSQLVEEIKSLVAAGLMSRETGIKILDAAGVDYDDDLAAELERIERQDFAGAKELADATGSEQAAAEYLHRKIPAASGVAPGAPPFAGGNRPPLPQPPTVPVPAPSGSNGNTGA